MKKISTALLVSAAIMLTRPANAQEIGENVNNKEATAKIEGTTWDGFDLSWVNGNDRRDSTIFHIPYFTPSIMVDNNYTHSFNHPIDHTVVGSTTLSRNDEMVISAVNFGGDFNYGPARARIITQFGAR